MCLSPITIKNPNYGLKKIGYNYLKDCDSQYIGIPCGHCAECIAVKQMYLIQRCQCEAMHSELFFITLTYNDKMLPKIGTTTGYAIRYADITDLQNLFKRFRKNSILKYPFRYFAVSELGSKRGRPHFHVLLFIDKKYLPTYNDCLTYQSFLWSTILNNWCRNYGSTRNPNYVPLCTYKESYRNSKIYRNYDCHYVLPSLTASSTDNVCWYVLKYMLKPSDRAVRLQQALHLNLPEDEYNSIWSLVRPRYIKSLGFGLHAEVSGNGSNRKVIYDKEVIGYLKNCIHSTPTGSLYPYYFNQVTGQHFPLSRYYKSVPEVYDLQDAHDFYFNGNPEFSLQKSYTELKNSISRYEKAISESDCNGDFMQFVDF